MFRKLSKSTFLVPHNEKFNFIYQSLQKRYCSSSTLPIVKRKAKILNGILIAKEIRYQLSKEIYHLRQKNANFLPSLAIVQVGSFEDSNIYIRQKIKAANEVGVMTRHVKLSYNCSPDQLFQEIDNLNGDPKIHGIIVQLPLDMDSPPETNEVVNRITPTKDVDGLNKVNDDYLVNGNLTSGFIPCTPLGCLALINKTGIELQDARAVVIGRSRIVGFPMAKLLMWNNAIVSIGHSKTKNLTDLISSAEILVVAIRQPRFIRGEWIKPNAVVIDCGINAIPDKSKKLGYRLVGDVDFETAQNVASFITPVPGGVGPMTVVMLIQNTLEAAKRITGIS